MVREIQTLGRDGKECSSLLLLGRTPLLLLGGRLVLRPHKLRIVDEPVPVVIVRAENRVDQRRQFIVGEDFVLVAGLAGLFLVFAFLCVEGERREVEEDGRKIKTHENRKCIRGHGNSTVRSCVGSAKNRKLKIDSNFY